MLPPYLKVKTLKENRKKLEKPREYVMNRVSKIKERFAANAKFRGCSGIRLMVVGHACVSEMILGSAKMYHKKQ